MTRAADVPQRILVVEDNRLVTSSLATLLRGEGYDPVVFDNGAPALTYLQANRPDMALIDIHLPDICGLDLAQELRQAYGSDVPVIIISGDTSLETLRALPAAGANYFFSKPVNAAHLLTFLRELSHAAKAAD